MSSTHAPIPLLTLQRWQTFPYRKCLISHLLSCFHCELLTEHDIVLVKYLFSVYLFACWVFCTLPVKKSFVACTVTCINQFFLVAWYIIIACSSFFSDSICCFLCDPQLTLRSASIHLELGDACLSAYSILLLSSSSSTSSCRALLPSASPPRLYLSVHSACPLSASTKLLSRTTSHQPLPVLLSTLTSSFLYPCRRLLLLLLLFLCSSVLRSIFPAWRARISCVVHASSSNKRILRYTAWPWPRADPCLSGNRSAWLWLPSLSSLSSCQYRTQSKKTLESVPYK